MDASPEIEHRFDQIESRLAQHDEALKRIGDECRSRGEWVKHCDASMNELRTTAAVRWSQADSFRDMLNAILDEMKKQQQAHVAVMLRLEKIDQDWKKTMVATLGTMFVAAVGAIAALMVKL